MTRTTPLPDYYFLQCRNDGCRFRFPAAAAEIAGLRCPRCRGDVAVVARAQSGAHTPAAENQATTRWVGLLDNIRSIHNTGSMFRTADGAAFAHLYCCGITPTPDHPRLRKAALGAQETVGWSYSPNGVETAETLRREGYRLLAVERVKTSHDRPVWQPLAPAGRVVLIVGNERAGVDPGILALCHGIISLPMAGRKTSLNVAVAFGIAAYQLRFGNGLITTDDRG